MRGPIVILGRTCAGKSTVARILAREIGAVVFEAGQVMEQVAGTLDLPELFALSGQERAERVIDVLGPDVVGKAIAERIDGHGPAIIVSLKTIEEFAAIRQAGPGTVLVWVHAPQQVRYERCIARRRDGYMTLTAFRGLDRRQASFGLFKVARRNADAVIHNGGTYDRLMAKCVALPKMLR